MPLTKEQILQASDLQRELVSVPEWDGEVWVRGLSGKERDAFEADSLVQTGKTHRVRLENLRARLCALAMCDQAGGRLFDDKDVEALGAKSGAALARVYAVAQRLSGIGQQEAEELAGNSASVRA